MSPERASTDSLWFQHTAAVIWDFDKTLIPGYMQRPLLRHFGVDELEFWREVNALPEWYRRHGSQRVSTDVVYLHHLLEYVRAGAMAGLSNELLRRLGAQLTFYPGLPDFFERLRRRVADDPLYRQHDIRLEHYVISNGLRQMILGSGIAPYVDDVWACEFVEPPIRRATFAVSSRLSSRRPVRQPVQSRDRLARERSRRWATSSTTPPRRVPSSRSTRAATSTPARSTSMRPSPCVIAGFPSSGWCMWPTGHRTYRPSRWWAGAAAAPSASTVAIHAPSSSRSRSFSPGPHPGLR